MRCSQTRSRGCARCSRSNDTGSGRNDRAPKYYCVMLLILLFSLSAGLIKKNAEQFFSTSNSNHFSTKILSEEIFWDYTLFATKFLRTKEENVGD